MFNAKIISTGSYLPNKILTNEELSNIFNTTDEWITQRTGIKRRHIAENELTHDLAASAAKNIITNANISAELIDLIIVATTTPFYSTPSVACMVQKEISAVNAFAFDINAACTGFLYSLVVAYNFIKCGKYKCALVIGAETISKIIDWNDRSTCVLFGDGAAGVLLKCCDSGGIIDEIIRSDGSKYNSLLAGHVFQNDLVMKGRDIFNFAIKAVSDSISQLLYKSNFSIDDIKYIIPHQANVRIIQGIADKMKIPMSHFYTNVHDYGNTSSASIPIALNEMNEKSLLNAGDKIILAGFGGGLTWGCVLLEW